MFTWGKGGFKGVVSAVGKGKTTACFSYPRHKFIRDDMMSRGDREERGAEVG